jgi:hypothetical protein
MIIWRGAGVLVIVIIFLTSLCGNVLSNSFAGKGYWETHSWPFACVLVVAGALIAIADRILSLQPKRVLLDEQTKERVAVGGDHEFFYIPMKWWGLISSGLGVCSWVAGWVPG